MHRLLPFLFLPAIFSSFSLTAQESLSQIYRFVNLPSSARVTALGGYAVALSDDDISLALMNPAALGSNIHHQVSFQSSKRFGDTKAGDFSYGHYLPGIGTVLHAQVHYIDYGSMNGLDEKGNSSSSFSVKEKAFVVGATKPLTPQYTVGINIKYVSSTFDRYQSSGLLGDAAIMYHSPDQKTTATLLFKNFGTQFSSYSGLKEPIPFEVLAGLSKRLRHLPFRYSFTYRYLNRWNLLYYNPEEESKNIFSGQPKERSKAAIYLDNLSRHLVINGEFLLGKSENFRLRIGYNQARRSDLAPKEYFNLTGLTFGFGFKVYHVRLDYGYARYHQAGNVHHFGISTALSEFYGQDKKEIKTGSIGEIPGK